MKTGRSNSGTGTVLACPECRNGVAGISDDESLCPECGRRFRRLRGIWEMLPISGEGMPEDARRQQEYYEGRAADTIDEKRDRFRTLHYNKVLGIADAARALAGGLRNVCEIGAGTAMHARWLTEIVRIEKFAGMDISLRALENGRKRWEEISGFIPVQASAYRLPVVEGAFDLAYFSGTLHHCLEPERAVAEAARALRPGGLLVISEPVWYFPSNLLLNLRLPEEEGQRLLKRGRVKAWCRSAGLEVLGFEHFNYLPWSGRLDRAIGRVPLVRRFSSMFRCIARK